MKYIVSKCLNIDNYQIRETNDIYKIIYSDSNIELYGIIFELNYTDYNYKMNLYEFNIDHNDIMYKYDMFLQNKIPNLKNIIKNNKFITSKYKIIQEKLKKNEKIYINIGYVKKSGFFNIPIINIL